MYNLKDFVSNRTVSFIILPEFPIFISNSSFSFPLPAILHFYFSNLRPSIIGLAHSIFDMLISAEYL